MKSRRTNAKLSLSLTLLLSCLLNLPLPPASPARRDATPRAAVADSAQTHAESSPTTAPAETSLNQAEAREAYGKLELQFEANEGQTDASVDFLARGAGYTMFLKPTEAVFVMSRQGGGEQAREDVGRERAAQDVSIGQTAHATTGNGSSKRAGTETQTALRMKLVGARAGATVEGADELAGKVNYFKGNDPAKWRANVPTYGRVRYREIYPGVDVVYYGNQRQLEYDFVVAPGGDARAVSLKFEGADKVEVDRGGDLLLTIDGETVRQLKPVVYQEVAGGERQMVEGGYAL
ncbi:MAG: hypothetical protein QOE47_3185, partial [Pyrinomonadaceae bacterium]|nr:hypothetical protein [Pyrinomonadaceae bacterium]